MLSSAYFLINQQEQPEEEYIPLSVYADSSQRIGSYTTYVHWHINTNSYSGPVDLIMTKSNNNNFSMILTHYFSLHGGSLRFTPEQVSTFSNFNGITFAVDKNKIYEIGVQFKNIADTFIPFYLTLHCSNKLLETSGSEKTVLISPPEITQYKQQSVINSVKTLSSGFTEIEFSPFVLGISGTIIKVPTNVKICDVIELNVRVVFYGYSDDTYDKNGTPEKIQNVDVEFVRVIR